VDGLAAHLTARYGITVDGVARLDENVFRIDGPAWVARCFPAGARDAVEATAELLRRLATTPFPAERLAVEDPVSMLADRPVLVTEFVDGLPAPGTPRMFAAFGALLGALHARSGDTLAAGGGWHHLVPQGAPRDEIDAARTLLDRADGDPAARRTLDRELERLDDCADLPHGVVHPDLVPVNALRSPDRGLVVIDWAGSGRGPRVWSLGFLLWAAGALDLDRVGAVIDRYREHVQLTEAELDRLGGAIRARPLTIDCWSAAHGRLDWARAIKRLDRREYRAEQIADRVRQRLAKPA
jgi:Ser/Thr protein kinase RdoA (MazF antagonist)